MVNAEKQFHNAKGNQNIYSRVSGGGNLDYSRSKERAGGSLEKRNMDGYVAANTSECNQSEVIFPSHVGNDNSSNTKKHYNLHNRGNNQQNCNRVSQATPNTNEAEQPTGIEPQAGYISLSPSSITKNNNQSQRTSLVKKQQRYKTGTGSRSGSRSSIQNNSNQQIKGRKIFDNEILRNEIMKKSQKYKVYEDQITNIHKNRRSEVSLPVRQHEYNPRCDLQPSYNIVVTKPTNNNVNTIDDGDSVGTKQTRNKANNAKAYIDNDVFSKAKD